MTAGGVRPLHQVRALGAAVEAWGSAAGGRTRRDDLPWRATREPWAVLVSETLAQQTQLSRVVPAYHRFLRSFPTPAACAAAPLGDVLRAWEGMGYNRRARNLHRAATVGDSSATDQRHEGNGEHAGCAHRAQQLCPRARRELYQSDRRGRHHLFS